jgi:hypothetical protein
MMEIVQPYKLPFLEFLGWQIADVYRLTQLEMLASYELCYGDFPDWQDILGCFESLCSLL